MTAEQQPRYAMTSDARKRLAEAQAELLAAADPHAWPESAELVELRATVARIEALCDRWAREAVERGPWDEVYTDGVVSMLRAALSGGTR